MKARTLSVARGRRARAAGSERLRPGLTAADGGGRALTPGRFAVLRFEISRGVLAAPAEAVPAAGLEAVAKTPRTWLPIPGLPVSRTDVPLCEMHAILPDDA